MFNLITKECTCGDTNDHHRWVANVGTTNKILEGEEAVISRTARCVILIVGDGSSPVVKNCLEHFYLALFEKQLDAVSTVMFIVRPRAPWETARCFYLRLLYLVVSIA